MTKCGDSIRGYIEYFSRHNILPLFCLPCAIKNKAKLKEDITQNKKLRDRTDLFRIDGHGEIKANIFVSW